MSLVWKPKTGQLQSRPRVLVIADSAESGEWLMREVLVPQGLISEVARPDSPPADVIVVDITQIQGLSLAGLKSRRERGDTAPAIVLAARLSPEAARDLFRLGVRDFLIKPYRPEALIESILAVQREALLTQSARQAVPKLQSSVELLRRQNEEYRVLLEAGRVLAQSRDLDTLLRQSVEAAAYLAKAEDTSIYLVEPGSGELFLRASREAPEERVVLQKLAVSDSFLTHVLRSGQPVVRQPSASEGRFKVKTAYMVQSLINVPIISEGQVTGVVGIYNRSAAQGFGEHHLILLRALAFFMGQALHNIQPPIRPAQLPPSRERPSAVVGEVVGPEFQRALGQLATETEALLKLAPNSPYRENLLRLRSVVQPILKLMPAPPVAPARTGEEFSLTSVLQSALRATEQVAELKKIQVQAQLAGDYPPVGGNPQVAQAGLQTLLGWAIARSRHDPVSIALFHLRSGEAAGPFMLEEAEGLPPGEWVALSVIDSGPRLSTSELAELTSDTQHRHTISPLGAAARQIRGAGGQIWTESDMDSGSLYVAFRAA
jgi:DNA-binding response OmpR family regulator